MHKGCTIRFPGGLEISRKKSPSPWGWTKLRPIVSELMFVFSVVEIFRKKKSSPKSPSEVDEKNSTPVEAETISLSVKGW